MLNILCEQLSSLNERYWDALVANSNGAQREIGTVCNNPRSLYSDVGGDTFRLIHQLNLLRLDLRSLERATDFEQSVLDFKRDIVTVYRDMRPEGNRPQVTRATSGSYHRTAQYLRRSASLRQNRQKELYNLAGLYVDLLRSYSSKHHTELNREDSISLKWISVITLLFLPLSLVATISGSNALGFKTDDVGNGVTAWVKGWILVAAAGGLTIVVFVSYFMFRRWEKASNPLAPIGRMLLGLRDKMRVHRQRQADPERGSDMIALRR
ncbi:hypothetical protein F4677DRAFT_323154 [Hypoxylon crocopeplum]|nr:hypothetical protein F4677DRAFT_323154 [Hypoxylon crocopeplum]